MITRVLRLNTKQPFARVENPLWQVATLRDSHKNRGQFDQRMTQVIPVDSLKTIKSEELDPLSGVEFQTFVSLENLSDSFVLNKLGDKKKVQFWIDRELSTEETKLLFSLLENSASLELVYLPDLHSHPENIFKDFPENSKIKFSLTVQMKLKKSSFDRWLTPFEMWDRLLWLQQSGKFLSVGTQLLDLQIEETILPEEKLFLLNPTYGNLLSCLKVSNQTQYWSHVATVSVFSMLKPGFKAFLRQLLGTLLNPSRKNWVALIHFAKIPIYYIWNLRNLKIVYPFRKTFWMIEYAIKKRLIGNSK